MGKGEYSMKWLDICEISHCVYGDPLFHEKHVFNKYLDDVKKEFIDRQYYDCLQREYDFHSLSTTGCRVRFKVANDFFCIRGNVKGNWEYLKIMYACSAGIDIYQADTEGIYHHICVISPQIGEVSFQKTIPCIPNMPIMMCLPCYNTIETMQIGVEQGNVESVEYKDKEKIIFYGHSVTQGASASRSGNIYPNIISRMCDCDVINYSMSSCCKGLVSVAKEIAKQNAKAVVFESIILEDTRCSSIDENLQQVYNDFYTAIRKGNDKVPIIIVTRPNYNNNWNTKKIDRESAKSFYKEWTNKDKNLYLIDLDKLFDDSERDIIAVDEQHLSDYGMWKLANCIYSLLKECNIK